MAKETVDVLIEGGKATAAPPLGPALGPMGVNIGQVVADINSKTKEFAGMKVPVKVIIDTDTKSYDIKIGTPPASALILKEAQLEKGSGNPGTDRMADLRIEQIIKVAKMKKDSLLGKDNRARVKEILGTCSTLGVLVEGKRALETTKDIDSGKFKEKIDKGITEISAAELKEQEEERKRFKEELEQRRDEFTAKAKEIVEKMKDKEPSEIKAAMEEAELPYEIIQEFMPEKKEEEKGAAPEGEGEKP